MRQSLDSNSDPSAPARPPAPAQLGGVRGRSILLWIVAVVVTVAAAVYQRVTGPTHSLRGRVTAGKTELAYRLPRSHAGPGDAEVRIAAPDVAWRGTLVQRRYPTDDPWTHAPMEYRDGFLSANLPHQPPAGKVAYRIFLRPEVDGTPAPDAAPRPEAARFGSTTQGLPVPTDGPVVLRFRGSVPAAVMIPHILVMFLAMLWSNRAGLEALRPGGRLARLTSWSLGLMVLGGLVFGPAVQRYAFGQFWTGFPLGYDLTDNKTLIACLAWLAAAVALRRAGSAGRWWVLGAALVTLVIFMVPHSLLGSELDYGAVPPPAP